MEISDAYRSREHAFIKHKILELYLERLFMIVGRTNDELIYIDCFSGPWLSDDSEIKDTSICISLSAMANCKKNLDKIRNYPVTCRALFIEKDEQAFQELENYLNSHTPDGIESHCLQGDFVALREDILEWCGTRGFAFFFIDPKGWKQIQPSILKPLLKRHGSEFLINFMYEFINRFVKLESIEADILEFFGHIPDVSGLTTEERENKLIGLYREQLKTVMAKKPYTVRASDVRIMHPSSDRAKYFLIYLTSHPKGIVEFSQISEKCELIQQRIRIETKLRLQSEKTGQNDIFGSESLENKTSFDKNLSNEIQNFWLQVIDDNEKRFGISEQALYIEETGYLPGQLQQALGILIRDGLVENRDDIKKRRRTKHIHFEKNERLRSIK